MRKSLHVLLDRVGKLENKNNYKILMEYFRYKKDQENTENTLENTINHLLNFCKFFKDKNITEIKRDKEILKFLDTKARDDNFDERWKNTQNGYLVLIKSFYRWLYNRKKKDKGSWVTPNFVKDIPLKKIKGEGKYSEINIWTREELEKIITYEPLVRNKMILAMLWDFNARPHEITTLKVKDIVFTDTHAEGRISAFTKTGRRDILLTLSFPYARDYINTHPHKNNGDSYFVLNTKNGKGIQAESIFFNLRSLKERIKRNLENGMISNKEEREELERLLREKKWNPYCFRHSSITDDSDYLTDAALVKKVGWSMNTKMRANYVKTHFSDDLKNKILSKNGIEIDKSKKLTRSNIICARCNYTNGIDAQLCSKCGYILNQAALNKIKEDNNKKVESLQTQLDQSNQIITKLAYNSWLKEYKDELANRLIIEEQDIKKVITVDEQVTNFKQYFYDNYGNQPDIQNLNIKEIVLSRRLTTSFGS